MPYSMSPLNIRAEFLRGNVLQISEEFLAAICRYRRETLMIILDIPKYTGRDGTVCAQRSVYPQHRLQNAGVVGLQRSAVVAALLEEVGAGKEKTVVSQLMANSQIKRSMFGVRGGVNPTALRTWDQDVTAGVKQIGRRI